MNVAIDMRQEERSARAGLSRLFEPQDSIALALVFVAGAVDALRIATGQVQAGPKLERQISQVLADEAGVSSWGGLGPALKRWAPRIGDLAPERDLATMKRLGGRLVIPGDEHWPGGLSDLGIQQPLCLWWRGEEALPPLHRTVAIVGSRDSTGYGSSVAADFAHSLAQRSYAVVSGGAYGIDAHAHRGALAGAVSAVPTVAVMAGGVDRYYPSGNEDLLRAVANQGAMIAEVPPGSAPTRYRFLQRNRIIAALSAVTVVVEARWRSGALNTAHHAESLGRSVAVVPGSIHSANSAGCHRLLRDGGAVCVTDAGEIIELTGAGGEPAEPGTNGPSADHDGLTLEDLLLLDALPVRAASSVDKLAIVAGLSSEAVRAGLGRLELLGLASRVNGLWKRSRPAG